MLSFKFFFKKPGNWMPGNTRNIQPLHKVHDSSSGEFEQAVIRVIILSLVLLYFTGYHYFLNHADILSQPMVVLVGLFVGFSLFNLLSFRAYPGKSHTRRIINLLVDLSVLSYGLYLGGSAATVCFTIYLWLMVGYGLRYGQIYLFAGTIIGAVEFTAVITYTEYWQHQRTTGIGLLIGLVALPVFFSSLLRKLTNAKASAEEANKSKSQFIANMSHEIRTPLNGVIGMVDLLNSTQLTREQKEFSKTIQASAKTLLTIIEDILDISKIEAGKFSIENTEFDLHKLINSTASMMKLQTESKGLKLITNISPLTPFKLIGDPHHLRQVLINLIGNAIKFTENGHIEIRISTISEDSETARIRFEVIDTGIGIPEAAQKKIFESFTQADSSTTRKFGGTGLGTTISKEIIELMEGTIGLHSTVDVGSNFWFDVPLAKQDTLTTNSQLEHNTGALDKLHALVICGTHSPLLDALRDWNVLCDTQQDIENLYNRIIASHGTNDEYHLIIIDESILGEKINRALQLLSKLRLKHDIPCLLITDKPEYHDTEILHKLPISASVRTDASKSILFNSIHATCHGIVNSDDVTNIFSRSSHPDNKSGLLKILIAEDNPTNQLVISKILEKAGHSATIVGNGQDALDKLESSKFDLVIMDMQMPVMGGIEAAKIYNFTVTPDLRSPIIILTANATTEALRECESANIDAYLTKPIEAKALLKKIYELAHHTSSDVTFNEHDANRKYLDEHICTNKEINPIDCNTLETLRELSADPAFLSRLVQGFISDTESLLPRMENAIASKKHEKYMDHIHALKGSSGSIGASTLHILCSNIMASDTNVINDINSLKDIHECFHITKKYLLGYLHSNEHKAQSD